MLATIIMLWCVIVAFLFTWNKSYSLPYNERVRSLIGRTGGEHHFYAGNGFHVLGYGYLSPDEYEDFLNARYEYSRKYSEWCDSIPADMWYNAETDQLIDANRIGYDFREFQERRGLSMPKFRWVRPANKKR